MCSDCAYSNAGSHLCFRVCCHGYLFFVLFVCLFAKSVVFFTNILKATLNSGHRTVDRMDRSIAFEFVLLPKALDSYDERNRASTLVNTLVAFCC